MTKKHASVILILITAFMLIVLVYLYYERQIDAMEEQVLRKHPS